MKKTGVIAEIRMTIILIVCVFNAPALQAQWVKTGLTCGPSRGIKAIGNTIFVTCHNNDANGGLFHSSDHGDTWKADSSVPSVGKIYAITSSKNNLYLGIGNALFSSTDKGESWSSLNSIYNSQISDVAINGNTIFASYYSHFASRLFSQIHMMSSDSGETWEEVAIGAGLSESGGDHFLVSDGNVYAGDDEGIIRIVNNGASWSGVNSGLPEGAICYSLAAAAGYLFAGICKPGLGMNTYYSLGVFRSVPGEVQWKAVNTGLPDSVFINYIVSSGAFVFAGTSKGVYISSDSGASWKPWNEGFLSDMIVTGLYADSTYVFAATNEVWRRPVSDKTPVMPDVPQQTNRKTASCTSKIVNARCIIEIQLPDAEHVTVQAYSLSGRRITSLVDSYRESGTLVIHWDLGNLPTGCFVIKMTAGTAATANYVYKDR